jgi:CheY-like chemotaxis protein
MPAMRAMPDIEPRGLLYCSIAGSRHSDGSDEPDGRAAADDPTSTESSLKACVLIVDDDDSVREVLVELLESSGFRLLQAADAPTAMTVLRQEGAVDVLVTDLTMPGCDGIALIRQAREIVANLPAVLLTGYAEHITTVATDAGGNIHVLRKPVESDHLIEQIESLLGRPSMA